MIAAEPHRSGGHKEAHAQGWLVSVLLHGTVALTAILLVKQIQLAPQDEAFKWNVAMVSPAQPVQHGIILEPGSGSISSSRRPQLLHPACDRSSVTPAVCTTDDSFDF